MKKQPHQIILMNGPRRSGKDTAANWIMKEILQSRHVKVAGSMKQALRVMFNLPDLLWKDLEGNYSSALKLQPLPGLFGYSWVETLIWYSEVVMKPRYGNSVFIDILAEELIAPTSSILTVVSDCGFKEEVIVLANTFGAENIHVFQLFRDNHTFAGDSREYVAQEDCPPLVNWYTVRNDYDKAMYRIQILTRVNKILGIVKSYD